MKIYVSHSKDFDFARDLYEPLRQSELNREHEIVLPHESSDQHFNSRDFIPNCDLILAEVSYPSTGQGIELGWSDAHNIPIIGIHKAGLKPPGSTKVVITNFIEYTKSTDLLRKLSEAIRNFTKKSQ